jgi:hypothetical protein
MKITHALICFFLIARFGCESATEPDQHPDFSIYRLKDPTLAASHLWDKPLESLVLADEPLLPLSALRSYAWKTHEFSVSATVDSQLAVFQRTLGPVGGIPFVVVAGTERIYLGAFWYPYSSLMPQVPYVDVSLDIHQICKCPNPLLQEDKRQDARIYHALKQAGILIE